MGLIEAFRALTGKPAHSLGRRLFESTTGDQALQWEDKGWMRFGQVTTGEPFNQDRIRLVQRARAYWHRDPLCKQAVRLWTDYAVGSGLNFQTENDSEQETLLTFWENPRNRSIFSSEGQRKSSNKLLVDGEVFFALIGTPPDIVIRRIDPLEITTIFTDPEDAERTLYYRRDYASTNGSTLATRYYRSLESILDGDEIDGDILDGSVSIGQSVEPDVLIFHVAFDSLYQRGNSLLATVIDWSQQHGRFMEDRLSIIRSLARFTFKLSTQATPAQMAGIATAVNAATPNAGSFWIENPGADLKTMPRDTGASSARDDGDMIKLMVCAGTGIMSHYMGDPSTGNLATATAMELPMLKQFTAYQQQWTDVYRTIFQYVLGNKEESSSIDVDWPPIIEADVQKQSAGITAMVAAFPEMADVRAVQMQALMLLGVNNVGEVLEEMAKAKEERDAKALEIAKAEGPMGTAAMSKKMPMKGPMNHDDMETENEQNQTEGDGWGNTAPVDSLIEALGAFREQVEG